MQVYKRLIILAIILVFIWLVASKRLTVAKLRKLKKMAGMAWSMM